MLLPIWWILCRKSLDLYSRIERYDPDMMHLLFYMIVSMILESMLQAAGERQRMQSR